MIIPIWAYAGAAGLAVVAGFTGGYKVRSWQCAAAITEALEKAEEQRAKLQEQIDEVSMRYEEAREEAALASGSRERDIRTIYRDVAVAVDCATPRDVRRVLESGINRANSATRGEPAEVVPSITFSP